MRTDEPSAADSTVQTPGARAAIRAFRAVYTVLTLNFLIPAISYIAAPAKTYETLDVVNRTLGGGPYAISESGHLWHMLGVGNVMTLAFMCGLLLIDLRRFYPVLPALVFLKAFSSIYAFCIARAHALPVFDAIFLLDGVTTCAMVFFAVRAYRAMNGAPPDGTAVPWYSNLLLFKPRQIQRSLDRIRDAAFVETTPNLWQIFLGVVRMWERLLLRSETIGTCHTDPPRRTWRARALSYRAVRLPFLLWERAVAPLDYSGLASSPDRVIRHLLGAHHDGAQFVYDLELLSLHPGRLEQLERAVRDVIENETPRTRWLRDLVVFENYHERLHAAVTRALAGDFGLACGQSDDPDITLRGYLRWCASQPDSPAATLRACTARDALARAPSPVTRL